MEILKKAFQMLVKNPLCNHCLGRQFALLGQGTTDETRGEAIKFLLTMKGHQLAFFEGDETGITILRALASNGSYDMARKILRQLKRRALSKKTCFLCEGAFNKTPYLANKIVEELNNCDFESFLIGIELPLEIAEREDEFKAKFNVVYGEGMKNQINRDIGKKICEMTSKSVSFENPDVVAVVNPFTNRIKIEITPLYIAGRYRKTARGIPQSRWDCRECNGEGCESCNWTGKKYQNSVEELIGTPILEASEGREITLHGAGREDVDVRMLGSGRPFVLEVKEPRHRFVELKKLEQEIGNYAKGKVEVTDLAFADKSIVRRLKKMEGAEKIYLALVEFDREVSDSELERLEVVLSNVIVLQETPKRVLHRRANLRREKYIYEAKFKRVSGNRVEVRVHCQGGLYVKELVTGDDGRTNPSMASLLKVKATTVQLDVLDFVAGEEK